MAKKKTRVALPGGIQGLVKDLQNNTSNYAPRPIVDQDDLDVKDEAEVEETDSQMVAEELRVDEKSSENTTATNREVVETEVTPVEDDEAKAVASAENMPSGHEGRGRRPKENTMREYHIVKDDSKDSWDLFIDMAQQYKTGGGKLATIYIDETLKSVLDRMKYAGPEKLSTSAILSSIVARFIYDHEEEIKKTLFSGNLI